MCGLFPRLMLRVCVCEVNPSRIGCYSERISLCAATCLCCEGTGNAALLKCDLLMYSPTLWCFIAFILFVISDPRSVMRS